MKYDVFVSYRRSDAFTANDEYIAASVQEFNKADAIISDYQAKIEDEKIEYLETVLKN